MLVFATIVALAALAYFTERGIAVNRDWVIHTYQIRTQLNDLQLELTRAQAAAASRLLGAELQDPAKMPEESGLAQQTLEELRKLTTDNPRQQERLEAISQMMSAPLAASDDAASPLQIPPTERRRQESVRTRDRQIDAIIGSMKDEEEFLLEQRLKAWDYLFKRNVLMLGLAFAVVTLLLAYNFGQLVVEISRTKSMEKHVRDNADSYRQMSARILESQDLERRRIARELHDSVGQYLAGLKINLSQLETGGRFDPNQLIRETIGLTDCAIQEVRTISHLLHPPLLEELGFLPAARWYVDEYGKRGQVRVSLLVEEPIERLPREVEIALFRVLQEALTNVYRHAAAQSVDVTLHCHDGHVTLRVADDGKGIPAEVLTRFRGGAAAGIGLAGMRERLAEFGGEISVESSTGGAVVQAVIPTRGCTPSKVQIRLVH